MGDEEDDIEFNNVTFWDTKFPKYSKSKRDKPIDPQILADPLHELTRAIIFAYTSFNCVSYYIKMKLNTLDKKCLNPIGAYLTCLE